MQKRFQCRIFFICLALTIILAVPLIAFAQTPSSAVQSSGIFRPSVIPKTLVFKKLIDTCAVIIIGYIILFTIVGIINKRVRDIKARHDIRKNSIYTVNFLIIITIFLIWLQNINSVTILLGFVSAGLALALQEVILSVAGWVLILSRRPFTTGDRIEINGIRGDVIDIRIFQTSLLEIGNWVDADQSTGRIVNVPNSFVFKEANYNYSRGFEFIWHEIPVLITFESNWRRAKDILMTIVKQHAEGQAHDVQKKIEIMKNRYMIYYGKLTPIVYVNIKDSGVELTLRYLTEAKKRRFTQDQIAQSILEAFEKESNVNFAYPTYRIVKD